MEIWYKHFFDYSPDLYTVTHQNRMIDVNKAWEFALGWKREEVLTKPLTDFMHPLDRERTEAFIKAGVMPTQENPFQNRYLTKDGAVRWYSWKAHTSSDGQYIFAMGRDITEEKSKVEMMQNIVENIPIMLVFFNKEGDFEWVNEEWVKQVGWSLSEMKGQKMLSFLAPSIDIAEAAYLHTKKADKSWKDFSLRTKSGKLIETSWANVRLPSGEVLSIGQDITLRMHQEKLIKEQQSKIVSSAKMSTLGEMAGGIAHEINNPLTIIHARAHQLKKLAQMESIKVDEIVNYAEKIEQTAERIAKIIKGLKSFSRNAEQDPFIKATFSSILDDSLELCRERFKNRGVKLEVIDVPEVVLRCRPVQISQVILNLLNNAFDAVHEQPKAWVKLEAEIHERNLRLMITDSGKGIPPHIASKMMEPFFSTKEVGKGTGLGLSISKGIIDDHQGHFWYDLACKHTRFILELPLALS